MQTSINSRADGRGFDDRLASASLSSTTMSENLRQPRLLANLPVDVLLKIFSECDVDDVLKLSAVSMSPQWIAFLFLIVPQTCKRLNEASGEHQTWLHQVIRLQIPTPIGVVASTAELKGRAIFWSKSYMLWVKPRDDSDEDDDSDDDDSDDDNDDNDNDDSDNAGDSDNDDSDNDGDSDNNGSDDSDDDDDKSDDTNNSGDTDSNDNNDSDGNSNVNDNNDSSGSNRSLSLHRFNMRQEEYDNTEPRRLVMTNLVPGGEFMVALYADGRIDLKKIKINPEDEWDLRNVAQYRPDDPGGLYAVFWSQLLTETNLGRPLVAYVDRPGQERYGYPFSGSPAPLALISAAASCLFSSLTTSLAPSNGSR